MERHSHTHTRPPSPECLDGQRWTKCKCDQKTVPGQAGKQRAKSCPLFWSRGGVSSGQGQVGQVVGPYCFGPCLMIWPSRTPDLEVQVKLLLLSLSWVLDIDMVHVNKVTPSVQTRTRGGGRGECVAIAIVIVSCESRESRSTSEKRTWYADAVGALLSS